MGSGCNAPQFGRTRLSRCKVAARPSISPSPLPRGSIELSRSKGLYLFGRFVHECQTHRTLESPTQKKHRAELLRFTLRNRPYGDARALSMGEIPVSELESGHDSPRINLPSRHPASDTNLSDQLC